MSRLIAVTTQLTSIPSADHPQLTTVPRCASFGDMSERAGLPRNHPSLLQVELAKDWRDPDGRKLKRGALGIAHTNSGGQHVVFEHEVSDESVPEVSAEEAAPDVSADEPQAAPTAPRPPSAPRAPRKPAPPKLRKGKATR